MHKFLSFEYFDTISAKQRYVCVRSHVANTIGCFVFNLAKLAILFFES